MDTKNTIIRNFAQAVGRTATDIIDTSLVLNENADESAAIVSTLNVLLEAMRSNVVLLQQALDKYK